MMLNFSLTYSLVTLPLFWDKNKYILDLGLCEGLDRNHTINLTTV
jgi:hypothetical protein